MHQVRQHRMHHDVCYMSVSELVELARSLTGYAITGKFGSEDDVKNWGYGAQSHVQWSEKLDSIHSLSIDKKKAHEKDLFFLATGMSVPVKTFSEVKLSWAWFFKSSLTLDPATTPALNENENDTVVL